MHGVCVFFRHDGTAGFVFGDKDLADTAPGTAGQPADIIGYFHYIGCQGFQCAVRENKFIFGCKRMKFVFSGNKLFAGQCTDFISSQPVKISWRVQTCADCCTAQSQFL